MHNSKLFDLILLGLWIFIATILTVDYGVKYNKNLSKNLDLLSSGIEIDKITVSENNSLDITLKNSRSKIIFFLPVEKKQKAIEALSDSSKNVIVFDQEKGVPVLRMFFRGKEISLDDYLSVESPEQ